MTTLEFTTAVRPPSTREFNALNRMTRTYFETRGTMGAGDNTLGSLLAVGWIEADPTNSRNSKRYRITEAGLTARNSDPQRISRKSKIKLPTVKPKIAEMPSRFNVIIDSRDMKKT